MTQCGSKALQGQKNQPCLNMNRQRENKVARKRKLSKPE